MRSLNHRENRQPLIRGRLAADERLRDQEIQRPRVLTPPRKPPILKTLSRRNCPTCSEFYRSIVGVGYWGYYSVYCQRL